MSVRHLLTTAGTLVQPNSVDAYTLTSGRLVGTVAALLALTGAVIGGLALARSAGRIGTGRKGAIVALVAGPAGMVIGGLVLAAADGGPGTGNGVVGSAFAIVLGLIGVVLGGLARSRSRRTS
jgi:FtsH-binding integral membrane protein